MIITPNRDEYTKELRRARKLGRGRVRWNVDGATALPHALLIALAGVIAWSLFCSEMFGSPWFTREALGDAAPVFDKLMLQVVPFSQILFVLGFWAVLEWGGRRALLLFALFVWCVPVLAALIFMIAGPNFHEFAILLGALSAFPSPFYALSFPVDDPRWYMGWMAHAFVVTVIVYSVLVVYLVRRVRKHHREIVRRVEEGDAPSPASREIMP